VRDNIALFGGDPSRVTIFGQSSGGKRDQLIGLARDHPICIHRCLIDNFRVSVDVQLQWYNSKTLIYLFIGVSVAMQILAYGNSKSIPFNGAIMQSSTLEPTMASNLSFNATSAIASAVSCVPINSALSDTSPIECLRNVPIQTLLDHTLDFIASTSANNDGDIFLPIVDQIFFQIWQVT
jgi:carboxylesterase type B